MSSIDTLRIEGMIYLVRGQKVMLDSDLADLYEVETKALNRAVRRHANRFPADFMFELSPEEHDSLRYQIGTLKNGGRGQHRVHTRGVSLDDGIEYRTIIVKVPLHYYSQIDSQGRTFYQLPWYSAPRWSEEAVEYGPWTQIP